MIHPKLTHPVRVAVVALVSTGLVDICGECPTRGPREGTCHPPAPVILPGAESLWGRRKVPTMSQALFSIQYICFRKTSGSKMGAPNLLLAAGAV